MIINLLKSALTYEKLYFLTTTPNDHLVSNKQNIFLVDYGPKLLSFITRASISYEREYYSFNCSKFSIFKEFTKKLKKYGFE